MHINSFRNEYFFLSNFYEAPVTYEGLTYQNNEAAFQAQKCADPKEREVFTTLNPSEAKRTGRKVHLRKDWEQIKVSVMSDIVMAKFKQNPDLTKMLLDTGDAYLEEGNNWGDRIWGTVDGQGANCLGVILMETRAALQLEMSRQKRKEKYYDKACE
jgi:ribA/ribD-fused uncharacterized protein